MEESILKLQLLEKKDLAEPEIDIRYSSMTQPLNRIVQYIRQQEYLIQGIFEKKLYQIGKWFAFSAINITWYSCVYILIMIAIHCYFYHISKRQADEINNFLKLRNKR